MIKKAIFIILCSTVFLNAQIKDTVEHHNLSLHFNKHNDLYKVINTQNNKEFNGWGWYENEESYKIFNYYFHNRLVYRDIRDLNNKIIRREYPLKNQNKLTVHEFYENNTSLIKKKYSISFIFNDEDMLEKKNGEYCEYYKNGKIKTKGQYKNDKKTGKWTSFDENGKML